MFCKVLNMPLVLIVGNENGFGYFYCIDSILFYCKTVRSLSQFKITIILISEKIRPYIYFEISVTKYMLKVFIKNMCPTSSRSQMFFKIDVLKNFADFTGNYLFWSLFSIKLQVFRPATLLKRDSNAGVLL